MIKKLGKYVGEYRAAAIFTPISVVCEVAIEVSIPFLISKLIDKGINGGNLNYVLIVGAAMLGMALLSLAFGGFAGRTSAVAGAGFAKNLRNGLFGKVQEFSFANIDKFSTPSLITRLTTDVTNVHHAFMMILRMLVRAPLMLISTTAFAFGINPRLALVFLIAIPVLGIAAAAIAFFAYPRVVKMLKKYDLINAGVQENLAGIRVVKSFVREDHESEKFAKASEDLRIAHLKAEKVMVYSSPIMMLVVYACVILILYLGGGQIIKGKMTDGQLTSFLAYVMQIMMSLMMIAVSFVMLVVSRASAARIVEILDEKIDVEDGEDVGEASPEDGSVRFENVCFGYKGEKKFVLQDIDLDIKSGENIGIIGGTGSSKTSLVQLIPRLYDATKGRVLVGGRDVREYKLKKLRQSVAMVLQKNVLFSGTLRDNLKWGDANASDEEILEVCKAACVSDFIEGLPDKLDADLSQGGVNVSGGQKQRLCIARALLKKPKIIILDDSTSSVDAGTDAEIKKRLKENLKGMTTVTIAQRIASVRDCDRIIVLEDGKINGIGTHEELLGSNEIYREVCLSQNGGEDVSEAAE